MKIVCDACSAKYSISDDKVQGKVFKIRCKKCSNIIVVRGNASAAAVAEPSSPQEKDTRVFDYGYDENSGAGPAAGESVWHVVIDQDQVGPLSVAEVQKRFSAGEIDADTYIWREGFADWLPISQVDAFSSLFGGGAAAVGDDSGSLFGTSTGENRGGASAVNDLFGGGGGGLDTGISGSDDDGDVFAARRSAGPAAASASSSSADSKLRGERGENSVLFSLSNLAQLASDGPRPQQSSSSSSSSSGSAQHGGGEGSGLIDIRSMANAYLAPDKAGPKSASPSMGSAADLPVFSSSGFGEPAVIVPIVRSSASNNNKLIYGLVGMVGLLAVVAVVMVVVLLKDKPAARPEQVAVAPTTETPAGSAAAGTAGTPAGTPAVTPGTPAGTTGTTAGTTGTTDTPSGTAGTPAGTTDTPSGTAGTPSGNSGSSGSSGSAPDKPRGDSGKRPSSGDKPSSGSKGSKPSSGSTKPPEDDPPPSKPSKPSGGGDCDAVACLVDPNQPCCAKKGGGKPSSGGTSATKPDSSLPEQLDSSMIKAGIDKVKGRAQACGSKSSAKGAVKVRIKATPDGKVGSVDVVSSPDDGLGSCVASALKGATFAKTQRGMGFAYTLSF
jgi:predicted Zn finger-like uncharacterized protein